MSRKALSEKYLDFDLEFLNSIQTSGVEANEGFGGRDSTYIKVGDGLVCYEHELS